jgi:PAS domain S-box-containing protein
MRPISKDSATVPGPYSADKPKGPVYQSASAQTLDCAASALAGAGAFGEFGNPQTRDYTSWTVASEPPDRYRRLVALSPDGILISQDNRIVFLNPAAVRLFGASAPEEIVGKSPFEVFHPESHALMRERIGLMLSGHSVPPAEEKIVRLDGGVTDVEVNSTRLEEAEGDTLQVIVRDISARKRAEAILRQSEERLTLAFAGAQEGVWDWNLETGAVVYSPRWTEMLGYAEDEIEPHVSAWKHLLHPDDQPRADELHASLARGAGTYEGEFRLRHKEGHYIHVLSRGLPVRREPGGQVVRIVGTHLDITERKRTESALRESEERLTLAFAGAQEGVWDWNLETNAVAYSPRWKQMLGYAEDEIEPHISAWERLVHPDDRARADAANDSVARGDRTYEAEFRLRHKDGRYVHVLSRGFPVRREAGGPVVRIVGTHFDLSERKQAEDLLRRSHEQLEIRVRERTAELATVNESLRAEIGERERAERARTELLGRLVFAQEDERRRIAREMHDQFGEQLTALGHRIASLKDAAGGRPELLEPIGALQAVAQQLDRDVDHLVWELRPTALDDLGLQAALSNYVQNWSTRARIAAELHTSGLLDDRLASEAETTLYRIAQEALTNVAKHSGAGNVEVILERRDDHVLLIVEDDGVGFDPGGSPAGSFGLLGMQERAALVGATLEIESAAGKGTTILVRMTAPRTVRNMTGHA